MPTGINGSIRYFRPIILNENGQLWPFFAYILNYIDFSFLSNWKEFDRINNFLLMMNQAEFCFWFIMIKRKLSVRSYSFQREKEQKSSSVSVKTMFYFNNKYFSPRNFFLNLVKSNKIWIVIILFRMTTIQIWFDLTRFRKDFSACAHYIQMSYQIFSYNNKKKIE